MMIDPINIPNMMYHGDTIDRFIRENYDKELLEKPVIYQPPLLDSRGSIFYDDIKYFLWWRTCLRKAQYFEANGHMVSFFIRELLVMKESEETIQHWLSLFESNYDGTAAGDTAYVIRTRMMFARGTFPERIRDVCEDSEQFDIVYLLAGPSIDLPERVVKDIIGEKTALPDGFVEFLDIVLERFASFLWEERDIGIAEFLSNNRAELVCDTITHIGDVAGGSFIADQPIMTERAYDKLGEIIKYCLTKFSPTFRKYRPRVCEQVKDIVGKALGDWGKAVDRPSEWLPQRTICTYPDDGRVAFDFYQRGDGVSTYQTHPLIRKAPYAHTTAYDIDDWDALFKNYIDDAKVSACKYVPCRNERPIFNDLNKKMLKYFVHWRSEVLKGNYMDTDEGYLSLLLVEILRRHGDKGSAMNLLMRLAQVYPCELTRETCVCFALVNRLEQPPLDVEMGEVWCEISTMHSLRSNPILFFDAVYLNFAVGKIVPRDYLLVNHRELCSLINHILNGFDRREVETTGRRLYQNTDHHEKQMAVTVFSQLKVYGHSYRHYITDESPVDDPRILQILRASLYVAVRRVCVNDCSPFPRLFRDADPETVRQAEEFAEGFRS